MRGRVLVVAGSDSGGGAGIQADIKTISMLDAYAATAITALTAQNTEGVFGVLPIPPEFIRRQIEVVLDDIGADAIKTGMLHDAAVIEAVVAVLQQRAAAIPAVVDPVMVAKGGARLIEPEAIEALKRLLLHAPRSSLQTSPRPRSCVARQSVTLPRCGLPAKACSRSAAERPSLKAGISRGKPFRMCLSPPPAASGSGKARASRPATPTAPAALSPQRSQLASPRVSASRARSTAPAPTYNARLPGRPVSAAVTDRSTTRTRCGRILEPERVTPPAIGA